MKRVVYLFCPECYDYKKVTYDFIPAKVDCKDKSIKFDYLEPEPYYFCEKCNRAMVEIDERMFPIILCLNQKGYKTKFCCEGHLHGTDVSDAYIVFDRKAKLPKNLNRILPSAWVVERKVDYDNSGLFFKKYETCIRAYFTVDTEKNDPKLDLKFQLYRENYMTQLLQFALKLPWITKDRSKYNNEFNAMINTTQDNGGV